MKLKSNLIIFSCFISFSTFSQEVLLEKVIQPAGKKLGMYSKFGVKSIVPGTGASSSSFPPAIEFTEVKNDGFAIRNEYTVTKYNENFEKEWTKEFKKIYGLQSLPQSKSLGSKAEGLYFIMEKKNPSFSEITITRFDQKGEMLQTVFPIEKKYDGVIHYYLNENGLNLITYFLNRKQKKMDYSLISFAPKDLKSTIKALAIESDLYEVDKYTFADPNLKYVFLEATDGKIILQKSYFKDIPKSKKKEAVIKTIEIGNNGEVSKPVSYSFLAKDDSRFFNPQLVLDKEDNSLRVFGYMTINTNNQFIDGVYVYKYNYTTAANEFSKQYELKEIGQLSNSDEQKTKIHKGFQQLYPIGYFQDKTFYYDKANKTLRLHLFNDAKGLFHEKLTLYSTYVNSMGDIAKIEEVKYLNHPLAFPNYIMTPESAFTLYDKSSNEKKGPIDFINSYSGKSDTNYFFWSVFERKGGEYDILVSVKESNAEIIAYKLKK